MSAFYLWSPASSPTTQKNAVELFVIVGIQLRRDDRVPKEILESNWCDWEREELEGCAISEHFSEYVGEPDWRGTARQTRFGRFRSR